MPTRIVDFKYNPGFKEDRELKDAFVVRQREFKLLSDVIRENTGATNNRHVLVIGPRGLGKTTLVRRIAAEVALDPSLSNDWYPVVFGEESYTISSAGEFWLEALFHLAIQLTDKALEERFETMRAGQDEGTLLAEALGAVLDVAEKLNRRLVIFVENLNTVLNEQMSEADAWAFRHTLQTEPRIMLFATATTYFDALKNVDKALFEQFKVHFMKPLSLRDCRRLWLHITRERLTDSQARPIQILTGGNPRLVRILAEFTIESVFHELMSKLSHLVDQYTDYFKGQLDSLPPSERKVFVALLEAWDPVTAKDVASLARVTPNVAGANLARLERRGAVIKDGGSPQLWQASERLFNIYYLMRRRGAPSSRVRALVKFMTVYYRHDQLITRVKQLAEEACQLHPSLRRDHYSAFSDLVGRFNPATRQRVLEGIPPAFFSDPDLPMSVSALRAAASRFPIASGRSNGTGDSPILDRIATLLEDKRISEAASTAREFVKTSGGSASALYAQALVHEAEQEFGAAEEFARRAVDADGRFLPARSLLIRLLSRLGRVRETFELALEYSRLAPEAWDAWVALGMAARDTEERSELAIDAFRKAMSLEPLNQFPGQMLALSLISSGEKREAESVLETLIESDKAEAVSFDIFGDFLTHERPDAERRFALAQRQVEKFPDDLHGQLRLAAAWGAIDRRAKAGAAAFAKAVELATRDESILGHWQMFAQYLDVLDPPEVLELIDSQLRETNNQSRWLFLRALYLEDFPEHLDGAESAYRQLIEQQPKSSVIWHGLGLLLSKDDARLPEAEAALRSAVECDASRCSLHHDLGECLDNQGKNEEAQQCFRKALSENGACGCALTSLVIDPVTSGGEPPSDAEALVSKFGETNAENPSAQLLWARYLSEVKKDRVGARKKALEATRLAPKSRRVWSDATDYIALAAPSVSSLESELLKAIHGKSADIANTVAWRLHERFADEYAQAAVAVAKSAVRMNPDSWAFIHTLAQCQVDNANSEGALDLLDQLLAGSEDAFELGPFVDLCADIARQSPESIERLRQSVIRSGRQEELEPLDVALRMLQGEEVVVATEVREVAEDVLKRVRQSNSRSLGTDVVPT